MCLLSGLSDKPSERYSLILGSTGFSLVGLGVSARYLDLPIQVFGGIAVLLASSSSDSSGSMVRFVGDKGSVFTLLCSRLSISLKFLLTSLVIPSMLSRISFCSFNAFSFCH